MGRNVKPIEPRPCVVCEKPFAPTTHNNVACAECRPAYKRSRNINNLARLRAERGATPIGSTLRCTECERLFTYRAGVKSRCPDCSAAHSVKSARGWLAANPDKLRTYRKTAKENYYYRGNRQAAFDRDGRKCVKCGSTERIVLHHIDGRGKGVPRLQQNHALDNLICLCPSCHSNLHRITEKVMFQRHPETVREVLEGFLHQSSAIAPVISTVVSVRSP